MLPTPSSILRNAALSFVLVLAFGGCKMKVNSWGATSSDTTVNGYTTSKRSHDGISRKLETGATLEIKNGAVTKFPKGAVIKLQENGGSEPRQGELRENEGRLELWVKEGAAFRRGSPEDESWLVRFLGDFNTK
jgi:hypothetical protein